MTQRMFKRHSLEDHTQALANFLPGGKLFDAKNVDGSVYRMFLRGLSGVHRDLESFMCLFDEQVDVATTLLLLDEWEATVGIPDDCFDNNGDVDQRRQQVLIKLAALGVQTRQDFIALAWIFGIRIEIRGGIRHFMFTYQWPLIFFDDLKQARFTMVVEYFIEQADRFTYRFPILFGGRIIPLLQCLFRKLVQANVDIHWLASDQFPVPPPDGAFSSAYSSAYDIR